MARIAMPIPSRDFDPTEVAASWQVLTALGHEIVFATQDGRPGAADRIMPDGIGLDPWGWIPVLRRLRVLGLVLRADRAGREAYQAMRATRASRPPCAHSAASSWSAPVGDGSSSHRFSTGWSASR